MDPRLFVGLPSATALQYVVHGKQLTLFTQLYFTTKRDSKKAELKQDLTKLNKTKQE